MVEHPCVAGGAARASSLCRRRARTRAVADPGGGLLALGSSRRLAYALRHGGVGVLVVLDAPPAVSPRERARGTSGGSGGQGVRSRGGPAPVVSGDMHSAEVLRAGPVQACGAECRVVRCASGTVSARCPQPRARAPRERPDERTRTSALSVSITKASGTGAARRADRGQLSRRPEHCCT